MAKAKSPKAASEQQYQVASEAGGKAFKAPKLPYEPRLPRKYQPGIGLIGCGGITKAHLKAYKEAGFRVLALCDLALEKAEERRQEFFPKAKVLTDYRQLLAMPEIEVVDLATHPAERAELLLASLQAGKHVLSQKPFVTDLRFGKKLVRLADERGLKLAVNQNGRWSPHFSYMRHAVAAGVIGEVEAVHLSCHWDHNWTSGMVFDEIRHLILYDYAIHWFDILNCLMGERPAKSIYATFTKTAAQKAKPPMLAQAMIAYPGAQASLIFDADTRYGKQDRSFVMGSKGTLVSLGPDLGNQTVTLHTEKGSTEVPLTGTWFLQGFIGTMAELLCAIEEKREPSNSAAHNLKSLELCFAAMASAESGEVIKPGKIKVCDPAWT